MRLFLAVLAALFLASPAQAAERSPALERVAAIFAMRPAEVRCPTVPEWADFTLNMLGAPDPELVYGVTMMRDRWMMLRPDLCEAALRVADETVSPSLRALAVLVLAHESYHVRGWGWRWNEARVECRALQHFVVAAQLLGATREQSLRLRAHAVVWHTKIAQPGTAYYMPGCRVPGA